MTYSQNSYIESFAKYTRFLPQIEMEYVYYYDTSTNEALYAQNPGLNDKQLAEKMVESQDIKLKKLYTPAEIKKGWKLLFDGSTLTGWKTYNRTDMATSWGVKDGAIFLDAKKRPEEALFRP